MILVLCHLLIVSRAIGALCSHLALLLPLVWQSQWCGRASKFDAAVTLSGFGTPRAYHWAVGNTRVLWTIGDQMDLSALTLFRGLNEKM
ncbi:MAG: hypothetical protein AAF213_05195, partial [Pseudomonadota bacterium]